MITSRQVLHSFDYSERDSFGFNGTISASPGGIRIARFNLAASNTKDKIASWALKDNLFTIGSVMVIPQVGFVTIGALILAPVLSVAAKVTIIAATIFLVFIPAGIIAMRIANTFREKFVDLIQKQPEHLQEIQNYYGSYDKLIVGYFLERCEKLDLESIPKYRRILADRLSNRALDFYLKFPVRYRSDLNQTLENGKSLVIEIISKDLIKRKKAVPDLRILNEFVNNMFDGRSNFHKFQDHPELVKYFGTTTQKKYHMIDRYIDKSLKVEQDAAKAADLNRKALAFDLVRLNGF